MLRLGPVGAVAAPGRKVVFCTSPSSDTYVLNDSQDPLLHGYQELFSLQRIWKESVNLNPMFLIYFLPVREKVLKIQYKVKHSSAIAVSQKLTLSLGHHLSALSHSAATGMHNKREMEVLIYASVP